MLLLLARVARDSKAPISELKTVSSGPAEREAQIPGRGWDFFATHGLTLSGHDIGPSSCEQIELTVITFYIGPFSREQLELTNNRLARPPQIPESWDSGLGFWGQTDSGTSGI